MQLKLTISNLDSGFCRRQFYCIICLKLAKKVELTKHGGSQLCGPAIAFGLSLSRIIRLTKRQHKTSDLSKMKTKLEKDWKGN